MRKNILDYWACLSAVTSGMVFLLFVNILIYGAVLCHEPRLYILIFEIFLAGFIFAMSLYVFWQVLVRKREVRLRRF